jgi:hypothetical protein
LKELDALLRVSLEVVEVLRRKRRIVYQRQVSTISEVRIGV